MNMNTNPAPNGCTCEVCGCFAAECVVKAYQVCGACAVVLDEEDRCLCCLDLQEDCECSEEELDEYEKSCRIECDRCGAGFFDPEPIKNEYCPKCEDRMKGVE